MSAHKKSKTTKDDIFMLAVAAIGVVYGDIGTSPLYAFREALHVIHEAEGGIDRASILGILSLILWSMILIVTCKYVSILLRIDNKGEGGTLALMALARRVIYKNTTVFLYLGILGAALFYADSMITPAISVISAVEGIKTVAPGADALVMPITIVILLGLFLFQSHGTGTVSKLFGPVMVVWFGVLGIMGAMHIADDFHILLSFNPLYGLQFIFNHTGIALFVMGAVFLAVTGAEALYADLGHFGRLPIQGAWGWFVFPALTLNYLGQGAMVLAHPETMDNPFFKMVSADFQLPLVLLATCATIIASQAVITGAYSLTRQAINLGLLPRLKVLHTSADHSGQIYMPQINYLLMVGAILLVLTFQSSSALAATYGISVTGAMFVDAVMAFFVIWQLWEWKWWKTALVVGPFLVIEGGFLAANMTKFMTGGWVPVLFACVLTLMMVTWVRGSFIINSRSIKRDIKLRKFMREYKTRWPDVARVDGTAFFMTSNAEVTPASLVQNLNHNKVLHRKNVLLSVQIEGVPYVEPESRDHIEVLNSEFTLLIIRYGFKDEIDLQHELLRLSRRQDKDIHFDWEDTSLFLSRRALRPDPRYGLPAWQDFIYVFMHRHATEPSDYYRLPASRVIEIGRQVFV